jgi:hypothetical protein
MVKIDLKKIALVFGSASFLAGGYIFYINRCYKYLKSIGYDGPMPRFFVGNLIDFVSKENSIRRNSNISHYSKTLQRWSKTYGKIYGYYEGHTPVLVLSDPDLVSELFINQSKLLSFRKSFPGSKVSNFKICYQMLSILN